MLKTKELTPFETITQCLIRCKADMELNPADSEPYYVRGCVYLHCKMYNEALADFDKAIEMNPMRPHYFVGRHEVRKHLQHRQGSLDDLQMVIDMCEKKGVAKAENESDMSEVKKVPQPRYRCDRFDTVSNIGGCDPINGWVFASELFYTTTVEKTDAGQKTTNEWICAPCIRLVFPKGYHDSYINPENSLRAELDRQNRRETDES